jgi:biopolymer transport protein ExbB
MPNILTRTAAALLVVAALAAPPALAQGTPGTPPPPAAASTPAPPAPPEAGPEAAPAPAPAPAPEAAAPQPPPPAAATPETVANPYGLGALWAAGDFVARGTLGILLIMSIGSWYVIVTKLVEQMMLARHARAAEREFWRAPGIREGVERLGAKSAFRAIAEEGLGAVEQRAGGLTGEIDPQAWITLSLQHAADAVSNRLQRGLAFLATVGSTAPFVGLFGTVWGIYHALTEIGIAGQASIDKVAGPVGEALIMTAMGLAVAVPAVLGYNWLIRRNKVLLDRVRNFAADLEALLAGGGRGAARAARSA